MGSMKTQNSPIRRLSAQLIRIFTLGTEVFELSPNDCFMKEQETPII